MHCEETLNQKTRKIWQRRRNVCRSLKTGFDESCQFPCSVNSRKSHQILRISLKTRWEEILPLVIRKHVFSIWGTYG